MPEDTAEHPSQETWTDWFPGQDDVSALLSREAFLERLHVRGIESKESDLRYWEYEGILPRPIRQWDPAVKARRAYYPLWAIAAVFALRALQGEGRQLRDMRPILRSASEKAATEINRLLPFWEQTPTDENSISNDEFAEKIAIYSAVRVVTSFMFDSEIAPTLIRYARLLERFNLAIGISERTETDRIDIIFTDVEGEKMYAGITVRDTKGEMQQH